MMKVLKTTVSVIVSLAVFYPAVAAQFSREQHVKNELLVKLKPGTENYVFGRTGARKAEALHNSDWTRIIIKEDSNILDTQANLKSDPAVQALQPNFYYYLTETPNDPQFGSLWGMSKISAPAARDISSGNANSVVAVIDTGIQYTHEDLAANI